MKPNRHPPSAPILQSVLPPGAVPARLRDAVVKVLRGWGYTWEDLALMGTATTTAAGAPRRAAQEVWVFAVAAGPLAVGDELEAVGGRSAGIGVSGFSGGVIPVTPFRAQVYERLGRRGGGGAPRHPSPPGLPTAPDKVREAPGRRR